MRLYDVIVKQGIENSRIAVVDGDLEFSYLELQLQSEALSEHIQKHVGTGRNIGLYFKKSVSYLISYFAVLLSENKIVPLDENITSHELDQIIEKCDLSMVITDASYDPLSIHSSVNVLGISITINQPPESVLISKGPLREVDPEVSQACILLPSSGTTGKSKRVMHSEQNILLNAGMHIRSLQLSTNDHTLVVLPLGFGYCNTAQLISHLYLGATIVLYTGLMTPATFFSHCERRAITCVTVVPSLLRNIVQSSLHQKYDLSRLKYIMVGGSKLTAPMVEAFNRTFPLNCSLVQTYGLTEAGPRVTTHVLEKHKIISPQCVGKAFPEIDIRIQSSEGINTNYGEIGEIQVRTPSRMLGYYRQSESTDDVLTAEGYLKTGDLGYQNNYGELFIVGRNKSLIIKGGKKISPEEIEEILQLHPRIKEARVFGEACDNGEERVHADIVLNEDHELDEKELIKHCVSYLSHFKIPQKFNVVTHIARTYNGKIYRGKQI